MNGTSILIVEDERITALELKLGLETLGYQVVAAVARGDEAVRRAGELRPDIVLMDINVEGPMTGLEAAEEIVDRFRIPIVFLTAYGNDKILQRALASRPLGYLIKPYETQELHATLQVALARRRLESVIEQNQARLRHMLDSAATAQDSASQDDAKSDAASAPHQHAGRASVLAMEQSLRHALEADQLALHYQPIVSLVDGTVCGIEALVRWRHPQQGLIPADRIIATAEATALIEPLGRWVLKRACVEAAGWRWNWARPMRLSVNISPRQLAQDRFEEVVHHALLDAGLPPDHLELEITGSSIFGGGNVDTVLRRLKKLGVGLAIDDFGSGNSSLSRLRKLPIDRLKIDRTFVRQAPAESHDVAIIESIMALCRTMDLRVTAKGVETQAQLTFLRRLGCEEAQGFLFSHPLSASGLDTLMKRALPWAQASLWAIPTLASIEAVGYPPSPDRVH